MIKIINQIIFKNNYISSQNYISCKKKKTIKKLSRSNQRHKMGHSLYWWQKSIGPMTSSKLIWVSIISRCPIGWNFISIFINIFLLYLIFVIYLYSDVVFETNLLYLNFAFFFLNNYIICKVNPLNLNCHTVLNLGGSKSID